MDTLEAKDITDYKRHTGRKTIVLLLTAALTVLLALLSLTAGSAGLSLTDVFSSLFGKGSPQAVTIIRNVRLPRLLAAVVVGAALSLSGCMMQNVLRNPLASASTLGVSQGASFGAAVSIICLGAGTQINTGSGNASSLTITHPVMVTVFAFLGGMATTVLILFLSSLRGMTHSVMVLAGVAISAMFTGATTLVQYFADDVMVATVVHWTFGNLGRAGYGETGLIALLTLPVFFFFFLFRWDYNAIEGGTHTAKSLGVRVNVLVPLTMSFCALIASVSVAFVGCINFIGLIASHIMRRFVGNDMRFLIPGTTLCGAALLIASDIACRTLAQPAVLPIGALTSFLGAPLFLFLIIRRGSVK